MRFIGLDVHRTFMEVAILEGGKIGTGGRVDVSAEALRRFAQTLRTDDQVVLEATCNTYAIARLLQAHAGQVVISNPLRTRLIAEARIKTDKIDAAVLAQLLASGFLPTVWMPDEETHQLRREVARRAQLVRQRTRVKNQIHAILHRNLVLRCPASDLFGRKGREWLRSQEFPTDERAAVERYLRTLDFLGEELAAVDSDLARRALACPEARRLLTIPGVDTAVALGIVAAIGEIGRFPTPGKLVGYLGLDPRVRQSGLMPPRHGRITKQGRAHARGMLVEAAWAAAKTPGPLRAFFLRVRARRGEQIAAVATARKLVLIVWQLLQRCEDYAWNRPSLTEKKLRTLELRAGSPAQRGQRGRAHRYNQKEIRERERALAAQAERVYEKLVANWQTRSPART